MIVFQHHDLHFGDTDDKPDALAMSSGIGEILGSTTHLTEQSPSTTNVERGRWDDESGVLSFVENSGEHFQWAIIEAVDLEIVDGEMIALETSNEGASRLLFAQGGGGNEIRFRYQDNSFEASHHSSRFGQGGLLRFFFRTIVRSNDDRLDVFE